MVEESVMGKYQKGEIISGIVTGIEKYGIFVSLDNRVTGLIHISEVSDSFVRNVGDYAELNETIHAKVIDYDSKHKKLKLSIKNLHYRDDSKIGHPIIETKSGFSSLQKNLDNWISIKEKELLEKEEKS